jgi:hypothetical protein
MEGKIWLDPDYSWIYSRGVKYYTYCFVLTEYVWSMPEMIPAARRIHSARAEYVCASVHTENERQSWWVYDYR